MVTWSVDCPNCKVEVIIETVDRSADCNGEEITCTNGCTLYCYVTANETMSVEAFECDNCSNKGDVQDYGYARVCVPCYQSDLLASKPSDVVLSRIAPIGAVIRDEHENEYRIIDSAWNFEPVDL